MSKGMSERIPKVILGRMSRNMLEIYVKKNARRYVRKNARKIKICQKECQKIC